MKYLNYIGFSACTLLLALSTMTACSDSDVAEEIKNTPTTDEGTSNEESDETTTDTWNGVMDYTTTGSLYLTDRAMVCSYNNNFYGANASQKAITEAIEGKGVLVSWRWLHSDGNDISFDVYRQTGSATATKLNDEPIANSTNYKDYTVEEGTKYTYTLYNHDTGTQLASYSITPGDAEGSFYKKITMDWTDLSYQYEVNDAAVGDLDGDGEYEIVVKRFVVGQAGDIDLDATGVRLGSAILDAYKISTGKFMWRVDMGVNILQGQHNTSFLVYDFTGDGKANVALRTAEGTTFGDGTTIGDTNGDGITDYRNQSTGLILEGPEFLSLLDGETGKEIARHDYIPRGDQSTWEAYWGDDWGNRIDRHLMCAAHLNSQDGRASIVICRGVYKNIQMWALHYTDGDLRDLWRFDTANGWDAWIGQGHHNLAVGDVDNDGKDEIEYGSCCVDHDGQGLWSMGLGHGDMLMMGKFDPERSGLQAVACHEEPENYGVVGTDYRDVSSGTIINYINGTGDDVGRCMVADIDPDNPGYEYWSWADQTTYYSCRTGQPLNKSIPTGVGGGVSVNKGIWWSGSLNRDLLDGHNEDNVVILSNQTSLGRYFQGDYFGVKTNNGTKCDPSFYGDIWGDWREELIVPEVEENGSNNYLYIFTTDFPTEYRIHPLMDDHVYRLTATHQNVAYNMPTNCGFYLGSDVTDYSD